MQITQFLFSTLFGYYIFTVFTFPFIALLVGLYQTVRYKKYNLKHSLIWLVISIIIVFIARTHSLLYYPAFGCDECVDTSTAQEFITRFSFGLFGSIAIYAFPFYRLLLATKKLINQKLAKQTNS